jgi:hypothetical protein
LDKPDLISRRLESALRRGGDTHAIADIADGLARGRFQAIWNDDAMLITEILQAPRRRWLSANWVGGTLDGVARLQPDLAAVARRAQCDSVRAVVRPGLEKPLKAAGWRRTAIAMEWNL